VRLHLREQVFPRDGLFPTLGATNVLSLLFHAAFATFALALRLRVTASTSIEVRLGDLRYLILRLSQSHELGRVDLVLQSGLESLELSASEAIGTHEL
jgi:hypothetical protein